MSVRAKMCLNSITVEQWATGEQRTLNFSSTYDPTLPEDQRFQKSSPNASAKFQIDNPAALAQFAVGKFYYFDFSEVPDVK